jgi:hydrogenase maturation protease
VSGYWEELERPAPDNITVGGSVLRPGSRVRLRPRTGADAFDLFLAGKTAVIEAVEQDIEGNVTLAVVVEDDPGRDLGLARQPGHRFFFSVTEVEPLPPEAGPSPSSCRILVAGIGNVFLGDDGFGVAVANRLCRREPAPGVQVSDFGIRGMDLAFAMQDGYDAVVLLDAVARGEPAGTLYLLEIDPADAGLGVDHESGVAVDAHGMDPARVLALVRSLGGKAPPTYLVGCEPQTLIDAQDPDVVAQLSAPVLAALEPAVDLVKSLIADIVSQTTRQEVPGPCRTSETVPSSSS